MQPENGAENTGVQAENTGVQAVQAEDVVVQAELTHVQAENGATAKANLLSTSPEKVD